MSTVEVLKLVRNILLRAFAIGVGFALFYATVTFLAWDSVIKLLSDQWHIISRESLGVIVLSAFTQLRFFLVFCLLTPALALHWTLRTLQKRNET